MYQRTELFAELSPEDSNATLKACALADKDEYLEDEAERFRKCRELIDSGKTYKQAAAYFRKQDKNLESQNGSDAVEESEMMLNISDLLTDASAQCGTRILFREVEQILNVCGLPEIDYYCLAQRDRFVEACQMLKQQNKSLEEVAAHFGGSLSAIAPSQLAQQIREAADEMESNIAAITDPVLQQRAEAQALDDAQRYMQHYVQAIKQGQAVQDFWVEVRAHAKAKLSGKPQVPLIREEIATSSTQPLLQKSTDSLESLENGTSGE